MQVSGVEMGVTVIVYDDNVCSNVVSSGVVSLGAIVNVIISVLMVGAYMLYVM